MALLAGGGFLRAQPGRRAAGWIALAGLIAALGGCAAPRPGAPVVHRAAPPAQVTSPVPGQLPGAAGPAVSPAAPGTAPAALSVTVPPGPATPPPAAVPAAPPPPVRVDAAPIRSGSVDARPLPTPAPAVPIKTEPSALKQPYSDALLAKLQAAGTPVVPTTPATPTAPEPPPASARPPARDAAPDSAAVFRWPSSGRVVETFAEPRSMGIAIAGKPGDPVYAAADGKVIFSGAGPRSYGNLLIIKHDGDLLSVYAHNRSLLVKEGQMVKGGQRVAELGDSGTDRPKLHFEIRRQGRPIDPLPLLPPRAP